MADTSEPTGKRGFLEELKRRHVARMAIAYAIAGWLIVQIATQVFPFFAIPNWGVRLVVILVVIGFPIAMIFAWVYEITPDGVRRTVPADSPDARPEHEARQIGRKLNTVIVAVLIVAVALMGWQLLVLRHGAVSPKRSPEVAQRNPGQSIPDSTAGAAASGLRAAAPSPAKPFNPPPDTIVVLPFTNLSGDKRQQYFSDGITEELTNALGQNTALRVIAWETASHYRDTTQPATAIGKALDVANVLTGKILRQGNAVRVIVELVNARTGYQVWSNHYDDSLANVFQVQDRISAAIAQALNVKFASLGPARTVNPAAHDLVLQARALTDKAHSAAPLEQARTLYEQAIALDPDYADAHAGLAHAWFELPQYSTLQLKEALPKVHEEANKALALDPRNVDALLALGNANGAEGRNAEAKEYYERALAIDPSNANAHLDYGLLLPLKQEHAQEQEAVQLDPDNAQAQNNLAAAEQDLGEVAQALAPDLALMRLDPTSADSALGLAFTYTLLHRKEDAVKAFDLAQPNTELAKALIAAGRLTYQSLINPKLHAKALAAVDALRMRSDLDPFSLGDVIQLELALGENQTALEQLPKMCAEQPVFCSDLSVFPGWIPLRGDPRFEALVKQYDTVSKPAPAASAAPASTSSP